MPVILSGFADEISPDLGEQLATLAEESISHLELRSVWSTNVADLDAAAVTRIREALRQAGVRVSAIGSPIGKVDIGAPFGPELERMRRVAGTAGRLRTSLVRIFSFYLPPGGVPGNYRQQVIDRMGALTGIAQEHGLTLAHENEKLIYGDSPQRCADLVAAVGSPAFRATFDAANFVQCGHRPFTEAYPLLRPYICYVQIKDARAATGEVVPAGQGDGEMRETLAALTGDGFSSYLSLEPHLRTAGPRGGDSGPAGFRRAAQALKGLLAELSVTWS
jgi:sugar phosphate isomerase/epimerase